MKVFSCTASPAGRLVAGEAGADWLNDVDDNKSANRPVAATRSRGGRAEGIVTGKRMKAVQGGRDRLWKSDEQRGDAKHLECEVVVKIGGVVFS